MTAALSPAASHHPTHAFDLLISWRDMGTGEKEKGDEGGRGYQWHGIFQNNHTICISRSCIMEKDGGFPMLLLNLHKSPSLMS
jgi:hypothetical protein